MATIVTIVAAAAVTAFSLVGSFFVLRSGNKTKVEDNNGEIVNAIKIILPKDDKDTHYIAVLYIAVGVFVIYMLTRMWNRFTFCKKPNTQQHIDDLENPRMIYIENKKYCDQYKQ